MSLVSVGSPVRARGACRTTSDVDDAEDVEDDTRLPIERRSLGDGCSAVASGGRRSQSASTVVSSNEEETDGIILDAKADIGSTVGDTEMGTPHHDKDAGVR